MMVGPEDSYHDEGQRVDPEQSGELLQRQHIIRERKTVWNTNFKNDDRDSDRKHTVRKSFDPLATGAQLRFGIAAQFTISVSGLPFSTT